MKFSFNKELEITQMAEGLNRKIVNYCDNLMVCEVHFEKEGVTAAMHSHPHEQCTYVVSGKLKATINDETHILEKGDSMLMSANEPHALTALEESVVVDTFTPMREDFIK